MLTLIIMDGFGITDNKQEGNATKLAKTPNLDKYFENNPFTTLEASGTGVGLPAGTQGNSEVGHMNMGAGRIIYQDLTRIDKSIEEGDFFKNPQFLLAIENCKKNDSALHLMGLISDKGVHGMNTHLFALLKLAKDKGISEVYIHCFLDGRDAPPKSAKEYIDKVESVIQEYGVGKIATMSGRYYAMDRDNNLDRVKLAYQAMTAGEGLLGQDAKIEVDKSYAAGVFDEFVKPTILDKNGLIKNKDSVIFFNYRKDRAKEISRMFAESMDIFFVGMAEYDRTIQNVHTAFTPQATTNYLGAWMVKQGKRQVRIAETEKFNHITFYFNALVDEQGYQEERILLPSEKVATYDLSPKMRAFDIAAAACEKISEGKTDLIAINLANPDMLGHTGNIPAAIIGIEAVDEAVKQIVDATIEQGGKVVITADHGNAEVMLYDDGSPCTSHTTNIVPFCVLNAGDIKLKNGVLGNIAPTILELMGIEKPADMTCESLIQ